ncbi:unnamed protein product [Gulo gulo]|uniref:Uncharacterized protein n=1 Tax=Gulo gulo TaxID=48420 RepID=A0A9X9LGL2_GULGU|nr:unnamed protein product [Gulo gulo]
MIGDIQALLCFLVINPGGRQRAQPLPSQVPYLSSCRLNRGCSNS